jgi:hypothetical protein
MSPRTPLDRRLDASPETLARWEHERRVREFFKAAEATDPVKYAEVKARHKVLSERQLAYRRLREVPIREWDAEPD